METTVDEVIANLSPEALNVFNWRYDWLKSAGYSERNAVTLARNFQIDWRFANELLNKCGDQERAMDILL